MANKYLNTALVDKAIKYAVDAHANTERRGKGFPYVIHVMEAMEIVSTITSDPELLAAAALHDTVEDTDVTIDDIRREFGEKVASYVYLESDVISESESEESTWRSRKKAAIERLANAPYEAKIVAMGDKLSNMRAIARDYEKQGDALWDLFHAPGGKDDHEWHYRGLAASLSDLAGTFAFREFSSLISKVFGEPKPELIDMNDYEVSGDGMTAISYFDKSGTKMIKLYEPYIPKESVVGELYMSWNIMNLGLNIPKAYRLVTDGKRIGVEFERIRNKKSYSRLISENLDKMEEYSREFARMTKELHSVKCDTSKFRPAEERFIKAIGKSEKFTPEEKKKVMDFIESIPKTDTCFHGDLHIGNAITNGTKQWWIDLADFGYGSQLLDLGMFFFVSHWAPEPITIKLYHINNAQILEAWKYFCKEYFGEDCNFEELDRIFAPYAALYMIFFGERSEYMPGMMEYIKENLLK